jgi:hypothetical protein
LALISAGFPQYRERVHLIPIAVGPTIDAVFENDGNVLAAGGRRLLPPRSLDAIHAGYFGSTRD